MITKTSVKAIAAVTAVVLASWLAGCSAPVTAPDDPLVGAWSVTATGAPYAPHLFTFDMGHTMLSTNPTGVQESATAPHDGTNDSVGMGVWKPLGTNTYAGTFEELNAFADTHKQTGTLTVTWSITLTGPNTFTGTASATQDGQSHPATLAGTRIGPPDQ